MVLLNSKIRDGIYLHFFEDKVYIIDTGNDKFCRPAVKVDKFAKMSDDEFDSFITLIDNEVIDYWDEITEIR